MTLGCAQNILPKARTDFRLPPEEYALAFEQYGIDLPPAKVAAMAHAAFSQYQAEMAPLAAQIAKANHYPSSDYRDVIRELKKKQITGEAILPFFNERLHAIEHLIAEHNLVTLPNRPAIIRLATPAETAQQPAPHMQPPPFLHNTGQRGEFVLPLNIPSATGGAGDQYDDFTFDAVAWTLTAHEARPGPRTAVRFHGRAGREPRAGALRLQLHQRRRMGPVLRVHHAAVRARRWAAAHAAAAPAACGTRVPRSGAAKRRRSRRSEPTKCWRRTWC